MRATASRWMPKSRYSRSGNKVAIVGFPGEMFAEFGLQLKEDSPYPITILAELANGALVYIPEPRCVRRG